jgi:thiol-disulfide isomerase/thioredoxin
MIYKKRVFALLLVTVFCSSIFAISEGDLLKKAKMLFNEEKFGDVLSLLKKEDKLTQSSEKLLVLKTETLVKLNRYTEALNSAKKRVEVAKRKSPWHCIAVVDIATKLKDIEVAFEWLRRAVDKGFLNVGALEKDTTAFLEKDPRLNKLVDQIKANIGIGKPVKNFSFPLIDGENFNISEKRGKVVLIDFWATWCPPCVKGIPFLKKLYKKHKAKGLEILGISLDSNKKAVTDYIKKENLEWKIRFSGDAWMDKTARLFNVNLIPSYWIIDKMGILQDFGYHLRNKENLQKAVEQLLSQ